MVNEVPDFQFGIAFLIWLGVVLACGLVAFLVGLVVSYATHGKSGGRLTRMTIRQGMRDLFYLSGRRIMAVARLTFKEAWRRKTFAVGFLFLALFMFAGWFLGGGQMDRPAKPYVSFVMTCMNFLLVLMALLVSCWGLPADIKARSLHTVVTKPVRRSEIVLGRMLGYIGVLTVVLLVTSVLGYVWILRQVPEYSQKQLIARVPTYGKVTYVDQQGNPASGGVNTGDIWGYRSFLAGATKAAATWTFDNLNLPAMKKEGKLRLEQKFEAFRTVKGDIRQDIRFTLTLVNPKTGQKVLVGTFPVKEFATGTEDAVVEIPRKRKYSDAYDVTGTEKEVDIFDDLVHDGKLTIEVSCVDPSQYLGVAERDLFIRLPDRSFFSTYAKSCLGLELLLVLIVMIGTTASCFLKGPVATIFTSSVIFTGYFFHDKLAESLTELRTRGEVVGGGVFESMYRLVTQMNVMSPLPQNVGTDLIKLMDGVVWMLLEVVLRLIPDLKYFNTSEYPANGFDVPFVGLLLPSILITLGYFIPLFILGYFSLQLRELEHK
ncbi:ABC transporter permease [Planctomicrobium sp. SH664]|uniref:ABC transporter permease n=1 Tax=Planctomicrobium sp. SH664 TaxID=3448125 RepID=UPI003F5B2095